MDQLTSIAAQLAPLATDPRAVAMATLLLLAAALDLRTQRIPNWLTVPGAALAIVYSAFVPFWPHGGLLWSLGGAGLGLLVFFPLYALRAMGAGDVKLMAMAGAFLGAANAFVAILGTFIAGGVLALVFALHRRALGRTIANVGDILLAAAVAASTGSSPGLRQAAAPSTGKLPFGVAIAVGSIGTLVAWQLGYF